MSDYSIYPEALDGYSQIPLAVDLVTGVDAKGINRLRSAIINIEGELGVLPSGDFESVVLRFEDLDDRIENLETVSLSNAYRNDNSMLLSSEYGNFEVEGTEGVDFNVEGAISFQSTLSSLTLRGETSAALEALGPTGAVSLLSLSNPNPAAVNIVATLGEVNIFGAANMGVKVSGMRRMGAGGVATPPLLSSGTYSTGDQFYHFLGSAAYNLYYDQGRNKWLSEDSIYVYFGKNGVTAVSQFYRGVDGLLMSATSGIPMPFNGTIVAMGYTRSDSDNANFEITSNGVTVATVNSTVVSGLSVNLNADVSSGNIIGVKNNGPNETSDVMGWVKIKFRG